MVGTSVIGEVVTARTWSSVGVVTRRVEGTWDWKVLGWGEAEVTVVIIWVRPV